MANMLLGEPDKALAAAMNTFFSSTDYIVQLADSGSRVLDCLQRKEYRVLVLEIDLPGLDGISVVRRYRSSGGSAPIILMTTEYSSAELQCSLEAGADVYIERPFQFNDLAAQVRALLRRPCLRNEKVLTLGGLEMNTGSGTLTRDNVSIHLHPMEYKLLQFLMTHPNQVFSSHALFQRVWQKDDGLMEDTVRTHIRTLRQKIDLGGCVSSIITVRGLGYRADAP
jgi:DNA-binding response OmpR family regulator